MALVEQVAVATTNRKKIEEISHILAGTGITLRGLHEFPDCPEVVEDAETFEGNALKKAREVCAHTGLPALADDSGLEVDALQREPGVYSARYSGPGATDIRNTDLVLERLGETPDAERTARFRCVIAFVTPEGAEQTFDGSVEGRIAREPRGSNGFGYDPVFIPEGHERTFAEMSADEKHSMSHRGRALRAFAEFVRRG
jgi:XTP/dITP diphosphohydrolase